VPAPRDGCLQRGLKVDVNILERNHGQRTEFTGEGLNQGGNGKVIGDPKTQAEGAAEKTAGKIQSAVRGAKDATREAMKKS
jgi:uncharacterized protein YjbJ (UPF0337 family)